MNLTSLVDPLAKYKWLVLGVLLLAALGASFYGGYNLGVDAQKGRDAKALAKAAADLHAAQASLLAAATALDAVNAEAERRKAEAEQNKRDAAASKNEADRLERELREQAATRRAEIEAARKNPDCATLLDTSVRGVCKL